MADDLFGAAAEEQLSRRAPLADRLRPRTLDDIVGQDHLIGPEQPLRVLIESDTLSSVILWGPPGTGKTTLARVIAGHTSKAFETLSAVTAGVKDVREVVARAEQRLGERGQGTILFLDEVHRFNKAQQDALLPSVESGLLTLVGATTENPYFEVNPPLLSRSTLFRLHALDEEAARSLVAKALATEGVAADDDAIAHLAARANGDGRHTLTSLDVAIALAQQRLGAEGGAAQATVTLADAEAALGTKALRYGRDDHYDVISAFIKSIRGSDVDAGLYWLATMLEAGEDARFIARRLIILASEDVGEADPLQLGQGPLACLGGGNTAHRYQAFGNIACNRHVRKQVELLEHHADSLAKRPQITFAIARLACSLRIADDFSPDLECSGVGCFQKIYTAQECALA